MLDRHFPYQSSVRSIASDGGLRPEFGGLQRLDHPEELMASGKFFGPA
jgi:hypothetical protein